MTPDRGAIESQRQHWQHTFAANPDIYGTQPSESGEYAVDLCTREHSTMCWRITLRKN